MKHVKYKANIADWNLDGLDSLEEFLHEEIHDKIKELAMNAAGEALQHIFKDRETYMYFPIEWNCGERANDGIDGVPINDPLTMYLRVGMEAEGEEKPTFRFSLSEVVDDYISGVIAKDNKIHGQEAKNAKSLVSGLRNLAAKINLACEKPY